MLFKGILTLTSLYISIGIVIWPTLMINQSQQLWWVWCLYYACPHLLALISLKGWHTARIWRRMHYYRYQSPSLSRGGHRFDNKPERRHSLEWLSLICLGLSLLALLEIWG